MTGAEFRPEGGAAEGAADWDEHAFRQPLIEQLINIVRRRRWEIVGAIVAALVLGLIITLLLTPQYTSSTLLDIEREGQSVADVGNATAKQDFVGQEFYETQYGLLRSANMAQRVAVDLRLYDDPRFFATFKVRQAKQWFTGSQPNATASRNDRIKAAAGVLVRHLNVEPQRLSQLVSVSFTSPDPQLSQRVADAWGHDFIRSTIERRLDTTAYARNYLEDRLNQLRARLDTSERQLVDYASHESIVTLPGTPASPGQQATPDRPLLVDDLARLNQELLEATSDRIRAQSKLAQGGDTTEALNNNAITALREKRAEVAADYARMMVQFEPDYPPAKALASQLAQLDRAIAGEGGHVGGALRETYDASLKRESDLQQRVDALRNQVLDFRRRSIQYNIYQRDVDTNRELYDALLQRYKAIGIVGQIGATNISIVDPAELPVVPSSPHLLVNLLIALAVGAAVGILLGAAREQLDQGFNDPATVESLLQVPLLGTTPRVAEMSTEELGDPKSSLSEAYLSLRTNLGFTTDHGVPRAMAITSSSPAEAKSTSCYSLALSLARAGRRVVIVDADMRSPSVHRLFNATNNVGLSNYLSGNVGVDAIIRPTGVPGLDAVFGGPPPPSAPELLAGDRFDQLVTELAPRFDHIMFDCPPVMGLADAPIIGSKVEGLIFVIEAHVTHRNLARLAIGRLRKANVALLGVILTKFNARNARYGYDYSYSYSYGKAAE